MFKHEGMLKSSQLDYEVNLPKSYDVLVRFCVGPNLMRFGQILCRVKSYDVWSDFVLGQILWYLIRFCAVSYPMMFGLILCRAKYCDVLVRFCVGPNPLMSGQILFRAKSYIWSDFVMCQILWCLIRFCVGPTALQVNLYI